MLTYFMVSDWKQTLAYYNTVNILIKTQEKTIITSPIYSNIITFVVIVSPGILE